MLERIDISVIAAIGCALLLLFGLPGCGDQRRMDLHGTISCDNMPVETGEVRFVPIKDGLGPAGSTYRAAIVDGQYQTGPGYGLSYGSYRVEVDGRRKTGRKAMVRTALGETVVGDETICISSERYAGATSLLRFEAARGAASRFDIVMPPLSSD